MAKIFFSSVMAGCMIAISAVCYLNLLPINKFYACFMFSLGLCTIIANGMALYTGKIGYIIGDKHLTANIPVIIIGNMVGAFLVGYIAGLCNDGLRQTAVVICNAKIDKNIFTQFYNSFMCGVIIYLAVDIHKQNVPKYVSYMITTMCVITFIMRGYEHSIANFSYFSILGWRNATYAIHFAINIIGNGLGSIVTNLLLKAGKNGN